MKIWGSSKVSPIHFYNKCVFVSNIYHQHLLYQLSPNQICGWVPPGGSDRLVIVPGCQHLRLSGRESWRILPHPFLPVKVGLLEEVLAASPLCVQVRHLFHCAVYWVEWSKAGRPISTPVPAALAWKVLNSLFVPPCPEKRNKSACLESMQDWSRHIILLTPLFHQHTCFHRWEKICGMFMSVSRPSSPPSCSASALRPPRLPSLVPLKGPSVLLAGRPRAHGMSQLLAGRVCVCGGGVMKC